MEVQSGDIVKAGWSSDIFITTVFVTSNTGRWTFYGVATENREVSKWDWQDRDGMLWVFHDGKCVKVWQETRQRPSICGGTMECDIEDVFGYCEAGNGSIYYAVKWFNYECPTWELEHNIQNYNLLKWQSSNRKLPIDI